MNPSYCYFDSFMLKNSINRFINSSTPHFLSDTYPLQPKYEQKLMRQIKDQRYEISLTSRPDQLKVFQENQFRHIEVTVTLSIFY